MTRRLEGPQGPRADVPTVTAVDVPLNDDRMVAEVIDPLNLPLYGAPDMPYWERYLHRGKVFWTWRGHTEVWVGVSTGADTLRHITISGLDKREALFLRSEFQQRRAKGELIGFNHTDVETLCKEIANTRDRREYQQTFLAYLNSVRVQFIRENGYAVVNKAGSGLMPPISEFPHMEILRVVYEHLPPTIFGAIDVQDERCPTCGNRPRRTAPNPKHKTRGELTNALDEFHKDYPQEIFDEWLRVRVNPKPGSFTSREALFADYREWVKSRETGSNNGERRDVKATALTSNKWGRLMRPKFKRHKSNGRIVYSVTLKRAPRSR